jgi:hypothetical protein
MPSARDDSTLVISPAAEAIPATTTVAGATEVCTLRTRFIHGQGPAIERLSIQAGDGPLKTRAIRELDKAKAARAARHPVANHYGGCNLKARTGYKFVEALICHAVG